MRKPRGIFRAIWRVQNRLFLGVAVAIVTSAVLPARVAGQPPEPKPPGTLMVWGDDSSGQVSGAPSGAVRAVAGGSINGLALSENWTPVLWGSGPIGPPPIPPDLADEPFRAVALGRDDAVLIRRNGTLAAFGRNGQVTSVPAGAFRDVTVASVHAVGIMRDGGLVAWGSDNWPPPDGPFGGLLNAPSDGRYREVAARALYSLALRQDGMLFGWGHGSGGGDVLAGWTPTPDDPDIRFLPDRRFTSIAAGNAHALAIAADGSVTGWGQGAGGALAAPGHVRFRAVAAGWGFSVGISTDGTLWGWGTPVKSPFAAQAWTFESEGWTRFDDGHFYVPGTKFKSLAAAAFHVMAVASDR